MRGVLFYIRRIMIELQVILVSQTRNLRFQSAFSLICRWGLWRALDSVMQYLDPLIQPTWQAHVFFAHLLRRPIFHGE